MDNSLWSFSHKARAARTGDCVRGGSIPLDQSGTRSRPNCGRSRQRLDQGAATPRPRGGNRHLSLVGVLPLRLSITPPMKRGPPPSTTTTATTTLNFPRRKPSTPLLQALYNYRDSGYINLSIEDRRGTQFRLLSRGGRTNRPKAISATPTRARRIPIGPKALSAIAVARSETPIPASSMS